LLHLRWAAANIDEDEFDCPHELQLDRKAVSRHLSFSAGPRVCPGAGISRMEQTIAWDRLLDRLESMEYAPGNTFLHQPGIMLGTLELNLTIRKDPPTELDPSFPASLLKDLSINLLAQRIHQGKIPWHPLSAQLLLDLAPAGRQAIGYLLDTRCFSV
jgi:hypothetical protein